MNTQPLIGIACPLDKKTGRLGIPPAYVRAIRDAGGIPVCLPETESEREAAKDAENLDGLLLIGGGDISPSVFGVSSDLCIDVDEARDRFEISLCLSFMKAEKPIFGICRGAQLLNAAAGGDLFFDIPGHRQTAKRDETTHLLRVLAGGLLSSIIKEEKIPVNSFHHQAVRTVAPGFALCAVAEDGTAEGIEHQNQFWLGVQWHPECLYQNQPLARALFEAFVREAAKRGKHD